MNIVWRSIKVYEIMIMFILCVHLKKMISFNLGCLSRRPEETVLTLRSV